MTVVPSVPALQASRPSAANYNFLYYTSLSSLYYQAMACVRLQPDLRPRITSLASNHYYPKECLVNTGFLEQYRTMFCTGGLA
jgi:hypothetical protein